MRPNETYQLRRALRAVGCMRLFGDHIGPRIAFHYSMTSSARARMAGGMGRPRALAVLRLILSRNVVGCSTGISAGFAPRKMRSTKSAARLKRPGRLGA